MAQVRKGFDFSNGDLVLRHSFEPNTLSNPFETDVILDGTREGFTPEGLALHGKDYKLMVEWALFRFPPGGVPHDRILNPRGASTNPVGEVFVGHRAESKTMRITANVCHYWICEGEDLGRQTIGGYGLSN